MAETNMVQLAALLIDAQNPRLPQPNVGQREALRAIATNQGRKLQVLAKDIVRNGLNPADLPIVTPFQDDLNRFLVLEGNRRIAALKALENPDSLMDAVPKGVLTEIRRLSKDYQSAPIDSVQCVVVKDRDEARHWIELRHTGENQGAGIVPWASEDATRFRARSGGLEIHSQALDFLETRGDLTPEQRRNVPATSFKRLIETPEVRTKLGIEVQGGKLNLLADAKQVAKALLYIANDLASGNTKVGSIYTKQQRLDYAQRLPRDIVVAPTMKSGQGVDISGGGASAKPKQQRAAKAAKPRDRLIPRDCVLNITDQRVTEIALELRKLKLDDYKNAISVLFRVFIELSADSYVQQMQLPTSVNAGLAKKLQDVAHDLVKRKKLTSQQAKPVNKACSAAGLLAPSVELMHEYVHNQYIFPESGDLRAHWDSLQPFVIAIWAP